MELPRFTGKVIALSKYQEINQRRGSYPPEFRQQMMALVRLGHKPSNLAKEFGCHETNISVWLRLAHADEQDGGRPDRHSPLLYAMSLHNYANNCDKSPWNMTSWQ
jgi:hypothetical protein